MYAKRFDVNPILASVECQKSDIRRTHFGCRIFHSRLMADRMSKIRHPTDALWMSNISHSTNGRSNVKNPTSDGRASDVEYSTFEGRPIEYRKSDIRRSALRVSNIRHSTKAKIGLNRIKSFCTPLD